VSPPSRVAFINTCSGTCWGGRRGSLRSCGLTPGGSKSEKKMKFVKPFEVHEGYLSYYLDVWDKEKGRVSDEHWVSEQECLCG